MAGRVWRKKGEEIGIGSQSSNSKDKIKYYVYCLVLKVHLLRFLYNPLTRILAIYKAVRLAQSARHPALRNSEKSREILRCMCY